MSLGYEPTRQNLILTKGADFVQRIFPEGEAGWPTNTAARLLFFDGAGTVLATWNAAVTAQKLEWIVQSTEADAIPNRTPFRLIVSYPSSPTLEYALFYGFVQRKE